MSFTGRPGDSYIHVRFEEQPVKGQYVARLNALEAGSRCT